MTQLSQMVRLQRAHLRVDNNQLNMTANYLDDLGNAFCAAC